MLVHVKALIKEQGGFEWSFDEPGRSEDWGQEILARCNVGERIAAKIQAHEAAYGAIGPGEIVVLIDVPNGPDAAVRELYRRYRRWGWEAKMALRVAKEHIRDRRCPQP